MLFLSLSLVGARALSITLYYGFLFSQTGIFLLAMETSSAGERLVLKCSGASCVLQQEDQGVGKEVK